MSFARLLLKHRRQVIPTLEAAFERYGDVVRIPLPSGPVVFLKRPEHAKHVLLEKAAIYINARERMKAFLGNGLVTSDGPDWQRQRRMLQPCFHARVMGRFSAIIEEERDRLVERWAEAAGREIRFDEDILFSTLNIASRSFFSVDLMRDARNIERALTLFLDSFAQDVLAPFRLPAWVPSRRRRRLQRAIRELDQLIYALISARRERLAGELGAGDGGSPGPADVLDLLLAARDPETQASLSDLEVRDQVVTLLASGHETTANVLAWCFHLLSRHPAHVEKIRRDPEHAALVVKEALRLYPPIWCLQRQATAEDGIDGFAIHPGNRVAVSPYFTQRDAGLWEAPHEFRPERFEADSADVPRGAYFPFGMGPRFCIGQSFAQLTIQAFVPALANRFDFQPVEGHPSGISASITLRPRGGVRVRAVNRSGAPR